jgi:hypothetical protein
VFINANPVKETKMKRTRNIAVAVVIAAVLLFSMTFAASAQTTRTDLNSKEYDCLTDPGEVWMEGNILHIRGIEHVNVDVSDTPELNGINTTVADAEINMATGFVEIRGTFHFQPKGIQGTWEGSWVFIGNKGVLNSRTVAHGTGALAGKSLFLHMYDLPYDPTTEALCAGIGIPEGTMYIEGYILDPGR